MWSLLQWVASVVVGVTVEMVSVAERWVRGAPRTRVRPILDSLIAAAGEWIRYTVPFERKEGSQKSEKLSPVAHIFRRLLQVRPCLSEASKSFYSWMQCPSFYTTSSVKALKGRQHRMWIPQIKLEKRAYSKNRIHNVVYTWKNVLKCLPIFYLTDRAIRATLSTSAVLPGMCYQSVKVSFD